MPLFRRRKENEEIKMHGEDSTVSSQELFNVEDDSNTEEEVATPLSIHPSWVLPDEQRYVFQFLANELPPLKPNQVSLAGIDLVKEEKRTVLVNAFVRNSLSKNIEFKPTPFILLGQQGEILARKQFDMTEFGELQAKTCRPWQFEFTEEDLLVSLDAVPEDGWKLAFDLSEDFSEHRLDLEENWEQSLSKEQKEHLKQLVDSLEPLKPNEVNLKGVTAVVQEKNLHVTLFVRNGSKNTINLSQLPLIIEDASGEVIAKGGFKLDLNVKPNASKPWTFIFPENMLLKKSEELDLSRWRAYAPE